MSRTTTKRRKPDSEGSSTGGEGLESTEIHEILSNERRVIVLELLSQDGQYAVSELAEEIAAAETGERPPPRNKRQSAYVTLDQTHLPKLDDLGIVDYDSQLKVVALRPDNFAPFRDRMKALESEPEAETTETASTAWLDAAIAIGVAGLSATAVSRLGLVSFVAASDQIFAEISLLLLFVFLVYQKGRSNTLWFESVRNRLD